MRKGVGEGRVEGTGVRLPPDVGDGLRMMPSILDRLLSPDSSGPVLSGLFNELAPLELALEGDEWRLREVEDDTEFRCEIEARGEVGCPLAEDTVGECTAVPCALTPCAWTSEARYDESPTSVSATPSS